MQSFRLLLPAIARRSPSLSKALAAATAGDVNGIPPAPSPQAAAYRKLVSPWPAGKQAEFLLNQGFNHAHVQKLLQKPSDNLLAGTDVENLASLIRICKTLNLDIDNMGSIMIRARWLINRDSDAHLKPRFAVLESIGMDPESMGRVLLSFPDFFRRSTVALQEHIDFFRSVPVEDEILCKLITRYPRIFFPQVHGFLKPRLELLKNLSPSPDFLRKILLWRPRALTVSEDKLRQNLQLLEECGLEKGSKAYLSAFSMFAGKSSEATKARFENLVRCGFTLDEAKFILRASPAIFGMKDETVRQKVDYHVKVMKRPLQEIVKTPGYLNRSLERRIKPRHEAYTSWKVETQSQKEFPLWSVVCATDTRFCTQFKGCNLKACPSRKN